MYSNKVGKIIKKTLKIGLSFISTIFILLLCTYFVLQISGVQNYLVRKVTDHFSEKFNTNISVKSISVSFFNKIVFEDVLIKDQNNDSLLYVHKLLATINSFSIKKRSAKIQQLELNKTIIKLDADSTGTTNYQFLIDAINTSDTSKTENLNIDIHVKKFVFNEAKFEAGYYDSIGHHQVDVRNISLGVSEIAINNDIKAFTIDQFQLNDLKDFRLEDFYARFIAQGDSIK